jgi:hypothetical protein
LSTIVRTFSMSLVFAVIFGISVTENVFDYR